MERNQFINVDRDTFCQVCLSFDRRLSSVGEYLDVFTKITDISYNVLSQPVLLCWECMAILKKIKLFKAKVKESQRILTFQCINKQNRLIKTLSKLTKSYPENTLVIMHHDDKEDYEQKVEIKDENDYLDDNNDEQNIDNNTISIDEVKEENIIDTRPKKHKKDNKTLHYKIVYELDKKVLRKKFCIQPDEVEHWLKREKNSDFYKKFKYTCNMCVHGFSAKEKLQEHILKKHDKSKGAYICTTCGYRFATESSLHIHTQSHKFAWLCASCNFQCYTIRRLNSHLKMHSAVQCSYCEAKFKDSASFSGHYKAMHSLYICDHCGKRCKAKRQLERHMTRHLGYHNCSYCPRRYKSQSGLNKHYHIKHSSTPAEDSYCVLCDKQFEHVIAYKRHVQGSAAHAHERDEPGRKKFPCPDCSNTYSRQAYMRNHYNLVHMNQSKYYCSQCNKYFLNRTRYQDHMKYSHEGIKKEKKKLCNICGRGFAANRTLIQHMRTHTGERPFECEQCSAKFTQQTSLLSHIKYIHMKKKRRPQWQH